MELLREDDVDSLGALEERIFQAIDLVARLRREKDAAVAERDAALRQADAARGQLAGLAGELAALELHGGGPPLGPLHPLADAAGIAVLEVAGALLRSPGSRPGQP